MTDTQYLDELIRNKGLKMNYLADKLGISRVAFNAKRNNNSIFTAREIKILCEELNITSLKEKERIFFSE